MKLTKENIQELTFRFLEACSIDNPSGNEKEIAEWVLQEIEPLSLKPIIDEHNNIFFHIPGKGEPVFLNAHLDSVQPCINKVPNFNGTTFASKGETVLGADDLAGVVTIITAIKYLKKHKVKHKPLDILFTSMEEIGGKGVKSFDFSQFKS